MFNIDRKHFSYILYLVFVVGLILDASFTYNLWLKVKTPEALMDMNLKAMSALTGGGDLKDLGPLGESIMNGAMSEETRQKLETLSLAYSIVLPLFLIWDFIAYFFLLRFRNWARVYVLSIAILYVLSAIFDFDLVSLIYGLLTTFFLMRYKSFFKGSPTTLAS